VAPQPPPPAPVERVILLPGAQPPTPGPVPPAPVPEPAPVDPQPARASGTLVVRTVPSGGTVEKGGTVLKGQGNRFELPVGSHALTLVSPSGERAPLPITIRKGAVEEICYDFDRNRACAP